MAVKHILGLCGAGYGEVSPQRVTSRNVHRPREWETRARTVELAVPKRSERKLVECLARQDPSRGQAGRCRAYASGRWPGLWSVATGRSCSAAC